LLLHTLPLLLLLRTLLLATLIACLHRCRSPHIAICHKRLSDDCVGWATMIHVGKLGTVGAGCALILQLCRHGRRMLFMPCGKFCWSGSYLYAARSAVETHSAAARSTAARSAVEILAATIHGAIINIPHDRDIHVVVGAVVVEMAATPVAALVAIAAVAIAVIDAAIVADVQAPVAAIEAVAVMPEAPVAGGPESALVRSLNPSARYPVVPGWSPCPVTGRPEIAVAGSRWLIVFGHRRRRLIGVGHRLSAIARIIGSLIVRAAVVGLWGALLACINCLRLTV
jgi:hypothetical protein